MPYSSPMGPWSALALWRYHRSGTRRLARDAVRHYREQAALLEAKTGRSVRELKILEIGPGQRFTSVVLFHHFGADITGVDLEPLGRGLGACWGMLRAVGPGRLAKTVARRVLFDRAFWRAVESEVGRPLSMDGANLTTGDAARLPFEDGSFDP